MNIDELPQNEGVAQDNVMKPNAMRRRGRPRKLSVVDAPVMEAQPIALSTHRDGWMDLDAIGPVHKEGEAKMVAGISVAATAQYANQAQQGPKTRRFYDDARAKAQVPAVGINIERAKPDVGARPNFQNKHALKREQPLRPQGQKPQESGAKNYPQPRHGNRGHVQNAGMHQQPKRPSSAQGVVWGDLGHWGLFADSNALDELARQTDGGGAPVFLDQWLRLSNFALAELAQKFEITVEIGNRTATVRECLNTAFRQLLPIHAMGTLELLNNGNGFITYAADNYQIRAQSTFVSRHLIARYNLRNGDTVKAQIQPPRVDETCPFAIKILEIAGLPAEVRAAPVPFYEVPVVEATLPLADHCPQNCTRLQHVKRGQRILLTAAAGVGKTRVVQSCVTWLSGALQDVVLLVAMIDTRPEEWAVFKREFQNVELIGTTFDHATDAHMRLAECVMSKARALAETGRHVVVVVDGLSCLARAQGVAGHGALRKLFGAARALENGGTLTTIATASCGNAFDDALVDDLRSIANEVIVLV